MPHLGRVLGLIVAWLSRGPVSMKGVATAWSTPVKLTLGPRLGGGLQRGSVSLEWR